MSREEALGGSRPGGPVGERRARSVVDAPGEPVNSVVGPPEPRAPKLTAWVFGVALSAIAGVALAIRSAVVLWIHPTVSTARPLGLLPLGDPYYYHWQGRADRRWPRVHRAGQWTGVLGAKAIEPSAYHPPLYSLYLAGVSVFGGDERHRYRLAVRAALVRLPCS